jgi:predicted nucleotidyltransferase
MKVELILVGALVSEVIKGEKPPFPPRRTNDADFAIRVKGWDQFKLLREKLVESGMRPSTRIEHRLFLGDAVVDLIPFGAGVTVEDKKIVWPDSQFEMIVVGFEEAATSAQETTIDGGAKLRCVSIPGLLLLKIVALLDRHGRGDPRYKDHATDIVYWLRYYALGDQEPRRYDTFDWGIPGIEYDTSGAAVLGSDVKKISSPAAEDQLNSFFTLASDPDGDVVSAVTPRGLDDDTDRRRRDEVVKLVSAFRGGYKRA